MKKFQNKDRDDIEIDEFYLLDGHHRWDYAVRSNQINKLKFILVNNKDVKIESYNFELNTEIKAFESILDENGFVKVIILIILYDLTNNTIHLNVQQ